MSKLFNYIVEGYCSEDKCLFSRKGKFFDNEDALNHFYNTYYGFNELTNTVNLAFSFSGGLNRNNHNPQRKVKTVKITNTDTNKTVEYYYERI
jgi:hypothetical protein